MTDLAAHALLERDREIAALAQALVHAAEGRGTVVVVDGPAGIGKSVLLSAARHEAAAAGIAVLAARGLELEREVPFGVAAELFATRLGAATADEREALLSGQAGLATSALDPSAPAPEEAQALARGLYWLTVNLTEPAVSGGVPRPLLIVVDDVHWADRPSLRFLAHLAVRVRDLPIALVVAIRSGEHGGAADLVGWLIDQPDHLVLRPEHLTEPAVARMIAAELPAPEAPFVRACATVSGGNPFLARELVRALHADGIAPTAAAVANVERLAPDSVVRSVLVRLARLGEHGRRLAAAVAVLGDGTPLRHAAALGELARADAERAADALARAHVLAAEPRLRFTHPLIATAVYADLSTFARAAAHRRAADLLVADGAAAEAIAAHLLVSEPDADPSTVATLRHAAARTLRRGDAAAAARMLRRALAEPPVPDDRIGVLLELAEAETQDGDAGAAIHLDAALALTRDADDRIRVLVPLARMRFLLGEREASARTVHEALTLLDDDDHPIAQALIIDELTATLFQAPLRARAEARIAPLVMAVRDGRPPTHPGLLAHLALRMAFAGAAPAQVRALAEQATAANPLVDAAGHGMLMGIVVQALVCVDELDLAEQIADAALQLARRRGSILSYSAASFHRAIPRYHRGALDDALADLDQALIAKSEGWDAAASWIGALQAHVHIERGDLVAAGEALTLGDGVAPAALDHVIIGSVRARLALADRAPTAALADAEAAGQQLADEFGIDHPGFLPWRSTAAAAALALGEQDRAARLAQGGLARARESGVPRAIGLALRTAASTADGERALAQRQEAVAVLAGSPSVLERAHATVELGAALRRAGQRTAAQEQLRIGLQLADGFGAVPLADTARDELRATGARPRRAAWTGADALTPTERRVAQLAAQGLTNSQIAQALFVTPKTIQTHLAHTYRKLDIDSRHRLAEAVPGLVDSDRA